MTRDGKLGRVMLAPTPACLARTVEAAARRQRVALRAFLLPFLTAAFMVTGVSESLPTEDHEPPLSMALAQTDEGAAVVSLAELRSQQLPKPVRKLFGKAVKLDTKGNTNEALACLNLVLDAAPEFIQAHVAVAIGHVKLAQLNDAEGHIAKALEIDPSHIPALEVRGVLLFRLGRLEESRQILEDLLKTAPSRDTIHSYLSLILEKQGHSILAIEHRETAEQLRHRPVGPFQWLPSILAPNRRAGWRR